MIVGEVVTGAVHSTRENRVVQVPLSRFQMLVSRWAVVALAMLAVPARATMPPVSGPPPAELSAAFRDGVFELPARRTALAANATQPVFRIPVILVSYSDAPLTHSSADFDLALFDTTHATTTGSLYDYYRWVSGNRLSVLGRVVATVQLPRDKFWYSYNSWGLSATATPHNAAGLVIDALLACASQVPWSRRVRGHAVGDSRRPRGRDFTGPFRQRHVVHYVAARRLLERHQRFRD
jgi:hypothetical protein